MEVLLSHARQMWMPLTLL